MTKTRSLVRVGAIALLFVAIVVAPITSSAQPAAAKPVNTPIPLRQSFQVNGRPAFVIAPAKKVDGPTPWVLYAPTLGRDLPGDAEHWMFRQFLETGIAIAGVDVGESFGSPQGRATYNALHKLLTEQRGFAQQACLLARSRGGLMLYCWAVENPQKVKCVAGIYPVCNLASYPGLSRACGAYGLTAKQLEADLPKLNPPDRIAALAKANVPILHIHGDEDNVVPLDANSGLLAERYQAAGGQMEVVIATGQGHNMWRGFFECQQLVDFVIASATNTSRTTAPIAHWTLDDGPQATDSAGQHHGVVHGATRVKGRIGHALLFDRTQGQHVSIQYNESFQLHTFTVAAWVKLTKEPTFSGILGTRFGGEHTFDMKVNSAKVHGDIGDGGRWIETAVNFYADDTGTNKEGGDLALDRWYYITYIIDDTAKTCRLYLDGDLKKRIGFKGSPLLMAPGQSMHIGHSSGTEYMDGAIDDVQIWDTALTDVQVRAAMTQEAGR